MDDSTLLDWNIQTVSSPHEAEGRTGKPGPSGGGDGIAPQDAFVAEWSCVPSRGHDGSATGQAEGDGAYTVDWA
jgi:hypothetical protein